MTNITCPDDRVVRPSVCSGRESCVPGSCDPGEACFAIPDMFDEESLCVPTDVCGGALTDAEVSAWEVRSHDAAREIREDQAARRARRKAASDGRPTATVMEIETVHTLVVRQGAGVAALACVRGSTLETGAACLAHVPEGTEVALDGQRLRLGVPAPQSCSANRTEVPGWSAEVVAAEDRASGRWAWTPTAPPAFTRVPGPLSDYVPPAVAERLPPHPGRAVTLMAEVDLDGDGTVEPLVRAHYPTHDPEKPGRTVLWQGGSDGGQPLATGPLALNGAQEVVGLLTMPGEGTWVVLTSQWMGGSGVHLVAPAPQAQRSVEVACGS